MHQFPRFFIPLLIFGVGGALAASEPMKIDFEPNAQGAAQTPAATATGTQKFWTQGRIEAVQDSALRASGKHALVADGGATIVFDAPMMNVRFFFVHGNGIAPGEARAYNADGRQIGLIRSRKATSFGDLRNFVSFSTVAPISMIEFSGGVVDTLQAEPFQIDYPLIQGQWVAADAALAGNRQGLTFDYIASSSTLFAAWYTYTSEPTGVAFEEVGALDNRWMTAQLLIGEADRNTASGPLFSSSGGAFAQANTGMQQTIESGTMSVNFLDCDRAVVNYSVAGTELAGAFEIMPLEKRVNPALFECDPAASRPSVFTPDISQTDADINMLVRAARDQNRVAIQFHWRSNKNYAGILHDLRHLGSNGEWTAPPAAISPDSAGRVNEDRVALIFQTETEDRILSAQTRSFGCFMACHEDMVGMPENTGASSHYIIDPFVEPGTYQADMWHWRGGRSGPMGFAEDTWVSAELREDPNSEGRQRDANSVGPDGNRLRLRENQSFATEYQVVVNGESRSLKLPAWVYDPALNSGFYFLNDGTRLIDESQIGNLWAFNSIERMEAGELQHALITLGPRANAIRVDDLEQDALNEVARQALAGGIVTRPFLNDDFTGDSDQHHVRSLRSFDNGFWTVTLIRDLTTGSSVDIDLSEIGQREYTFGVAVHDSNNGGRSHQVSVPLTLGGDIVPVLVDDVEQIDWLSMPAFSTVLFKPGDMSFEWLQDKDNGHAIPIEARCSTCHGQGGVATRAPVNVQD